MSRTLSAVFHRRRGRQAPWRFHPHSCSTFRGSASPATELAPKRGGSHGTKALQGDRRVRLNSALASGRSQEQEENLGLSWRVTLTISPARSFLPGPSGSGILGLPLLLVGDLRYCRRALSVPPPVCLLAARLTVTARQRLAGAGRPAHRPSANKPESRAMTTRLAPRNRSDESILWRSLGIFTKALGRCLLRKAQAPKGTPIPFGARSTHLQSLNARGYLET
jgi:hypothetical protein